MLWLWALALAMILLGWRLWRQGRAAQRETGLPAGRLVYADPGDAAWQATAQPLYSARYRLVGKPDYLVETARGLIPVEVKSSAGPAVPYLGHLLQLAAYCLLVEETGGQSPPHGLIQYQDKLFEVDFTLELRQELLETMAAIREARLAETVGRSHDNPAKCGRCGFRGGCDQALA